MENKTESTSNSTSKVKVFFFDWVIPILIAIAIALLIKNYLLFQVSVPTGSMIPTIEEEDRFMVAKVYNYDKLKRGDIVVFESSELDDTLIKRLIGLPNDHIEIKDGIISVNGEVLDEDYVKNPASDAINKKTDKTFDVPEGKYLFLGDNRNDSCDARYWKKPYIDESAIQGKVLFRSYPLDRFGKVE